MSDRQPDKDLGMQRLIARRDFLNGAAMTAGTAAWLLGMEQPAKAAQQDAPDYYPPAFTGMRGTPDGSFEAAHALRDGTFWKTAGPPVDTRETYDLIVIGGQRRHSRDRIAV
jgi:spermidine dehydrogenase